jgi:hypothetical protein
MRNNDIRATGNSNIPSCDKQAAYSGYPRSNDSENHDWNATPGPSHPYNRRHEHDNHDYDHDRSNSCTNMTTQDIKWQGNDPDNLDDSSSLDGTYRPSHLSQDEVSNSYPSSRTKDRDWHKHQSHSSNQT